MPVGVPGEQVRVFLEAVREVLLGESIEDGRVGGVSLRDELRRRLVILLFSSVNGDLRLRDLIHFGCLFRWHGSAS